MKIPPTTMQLVTTPNIRHVYLQSSKSLPAGPQALPFQLLRVSRDIENWTCISHLRLGHHCLILALDINVLFTLSESDTQATLGDAHKFVALASKSFRGSCAWSSTIFVSMNDSMTQVHTTHSTSQFPWNLPWSLLGISKHLLSTTYSATRVYNIATYRPKDELDSN